MAAVYADGREVIIGDEVRATCDVVIARRGDLGIVTSTDSHQVSLPYFDAKWESCFELVRRNSEDK